jgi:hypothetical protein
VLAHRFPESLSIIECFGCSPVAAVHVQAFQDYAFEYARFVTLRPSMLSTSNAMNASGVEPRFKRAHSQSCRSPACHRIECDEFPVEHAVRRQLRKELDGNAAMPNPARLL